MIRICLLSTVIALAACTSARHAEGPAQRSRPARVATLDSASATRLCENADSARAGLAGCRLRDQRLF